MNNQIVEFIRKKDFQFIKELGRGSCGRTVLLYDSLINENFVCKKYEPVEEIHKDLFFQNFIQEIKLLHLVHHPNLVRVFNYYIYPKQLTGYVMMEYVNGNNIEDYLESNPENVNEIFFQVIDGFNYLEQNGILHRDIRVENIMITDKGVVKIIDFGFGKKIGDTNDFDKSISLNWICETPQEFKNKTYDFGTEIYFIGKLFEKILAEKKLETFKFEPLLEKMCAINPQKRIPTFFDIKKEILDNQLQEIDFSYDEREIYQNFSWSLFSSLAKIMDGAKYYEDIDYIQSKLESLYKKVMLETFLPDNSKLIRCFINGAYSYYKQKPMLYVEYLKSFITLFKSCSTEKRNIIISNIHSKLDAVKRSKDKNDYDDIPF